MPALEPDRIRLLPEPHVLFEIDPNGARGVLERLAVEPPAFGALLFEGTALSVLLPERSSARLGDLLRRSRPCPGTFGVLTFDFEFEWDVFGFLARVTDLLARERIPVGVLAGARRDHLYVPHERAERALVVLREAAAEGRLAFERSADEEA